MRLQRMVPLECTSPVKEQFDEEIDKGIKDVKAGRAYPADAV